MKTRTAIATGVSLGLATLLAQANLAGTDASPTNTPFTPSFQQEQLTLKRYIVLFDKQPTTHRQHTLSDTTTETAETREHLFSAQQATDVISTSGGRSIMPLSSIAGMAAELNDEQRKQLEQHPDIRLIEEDPVRELQADYKGAMEKIPWGINHVQADQLSDAATGNMKVCIVDTGYELSHEDLPSGANITGEVSNTLLTTYGERDLGNWSVDSWGHGTHMAGTIAALGNNTIGSWGLNPNGLLNLHIVKVIDQANWWPLIGSDLIAGVEACQAAGANIVNLSLAGTSSSEAERLAMEAAYNAGMLVFGAAGHSGNSAEFFPASYESVISVAAVDQNNARWNGSPYNDQVEFSAPGVQLRSTKIYSTYGDQDGTSVATAYMSGVAALVWSHHPECTNTEIRHILQTTAKDLGDEGRDTSFGYGLVQAKDAVDLIAMNGCDGLFNTPPVIDGQFPATTEEDVPFSFIPTVTDEDAEDTHTFSATNIPVWASFDETTGELSGHPDNDDVGVYQNIAITVTDSAGDSDTLGPVSLAVLNVNDAPTFTSAPVTTATQDQPYHYQVRVEDVDPDTILTVYASTLPTFLEFDMDSLILSGTPGNNFAGKSWEVVLTATDADVNVQQSFTVTVENVNDSPTISGEPRNSVSEVGAYQFDPVVTDPDLDDVHTFSITGKPGWAQFDTATGRLNGSPAGHPATEYTNIVISVNDGTETVSLPPFSITVVANSYSDWENVGEPNQASEWLPLPDFQTVDFSQTRNATYQQQRTVQARELDQQTGAIINVGEPTIDTREMLVHELRMVSVNASDWEQTSELDNCTAWTPAADTIDKGTEFSQNRDCDRGRTRQWDYRIDNNSIHSRTESGSIRVTQTQQATGTLCTWQAIDPIYDDWSNTGEGYNYSAWSPAPSTQTANFSQQQSYDQNQQRTRTNREQCQQTGETRAIDEVIETQTIPLQQSRTVNVNAGNWRTVGERSCDSWTPAQNTVDDGKTFSQTRQCTQAKERDWQYTADAAVLHTRTEPSADTSTETQQATGTLCTWNAIDPSYTNWVNVGAGYSYSPWTPAPSTQTHDFVQNQHYSQDQTRTRQNREQCIQSGRTRATGSPIPENQTVQPIVNRTMNVSHDDWTDVGSQSCTEWSPSPDTIDKGTSFTQSRQCFQDRTRNWFYKVDGVTRHTRPENGEFNDLENRQQTGTKCDWIGIDPVVKLDWHDHGSPTHYGAWSPAFNRQTTNFTQSRSVEQPQRRVLQGYQRCVQTGETRPVGQQYEEYRKVNNGQKRTVFVTVSVTPGEPSCSSWSPVPDTIEYGVPFTQTGQCNRDVETDWTFRLSNNNAVYSWQSVRPESFSETRPATGTRCDWDTRVITYGSWDSISSPYDFSAWSPSVGNQSADFTQTRTYKQDEERAIENVEYCVQNPSITRPAPDRIERRTVTRTQSRTVAVNFSPWENDGSPKNCSAWAPSADTIIYGKQFTQTRDCIQPVKRSVTYTTQGQSIGSRTEADSRPVSLSQPKIGTKDYIEKFSTKQGPPYNVGGRYGYSAWSDVCENHDVGTTFNRSRTYKQNQEQVIEEFAHWRVKGKVKTGQSIKPLTTTGTENQSAVAGCRPTTKWVNKGWSFHLRFREGEFYKYNAIPITPVTIGGSCTTPGQEVFTDKYYEEIEVCDYGENCRYLGFSAEVKTARCE